MRLLAAQVAAALWMFSMCATGVEGGSSSPGGASSLFPSRWFSWTKRRRPPAAGRGALDLAGLPPDIAAVVECSSRYYLAEIVNAFRRDKATSLLPKGDKAATSSTLALHSRRQRRKHVQLLKQSLWNRDESTKASSPYHAFKAQLRSLMSSRAQRKSEVRGGGGNIMTSRKPLSSLSESPSESSSSSSSEQSSESSENNNITAAAASSAPSSDPRPQRRISHDRLLNAWELNLSHDEDLDELYEDIVVLETQLRHKFQSQMEQEQDIALYNTRKVVGRNDDDNEDSNDNEEDEDATSTATTTTTSTATATKSAAHRDAVHELKTQLTTRQLYNKMQDLQNHVSTLNLYCDKVQTAVQYTSEQANELRLELDRRHTADREYLAQYEVQVNTMQTEMNEKLQAEIRDAIESIYQPMITRASSEAYQSVMATIPDRVQEVVENIQKETHELILSEQEHSMKMVEALQMQREELERAMKIRFHTLEGRQRRLERQKTYRRWLRQWRQVAWDPKEQGQDEVNEGQEVIEIAGEQGIDAMTHEGLDEQEEKQEQATAPSPPPHSNDVESPLAEFMHMCSDMDVTETEGGALLNENESTTTIEQADDDVLPTAIPDETDVIHDDSVATTNTTTTKEDDASSSSSPKKQQQQTLEFITTPIMEWFMTPR